MGSTSGTNDCCIRPLHDRDVVVTACGRVCMHRKCATNISPVLAGQRIGIKEADEGIWIVSIAPPSKRYR